MLVQGGDIAKCYSAHETNTLLSLTDVLYKILLETLNTALFVYLQSHPQGLCYVQGKKMLFLAGCTSPFRKFLRVHSVGSIYN